MADHDHHRRIVLPVAIVSVPVRGVEQRVEDHVGGRVMVAVEDRLHPGVVDELAVAIEPLQDAADSDPPSRASRSRSGPPRFDRR